MKLQREAPQYNQKDTLAEVFSCNFYKICKSTFYEKDPQAIPCEYKMLIKSSLISGTWRIHEDLNRETAFGGF